MTCPMPNRRLTIDQARTIRETAARPGHKGMTQHALAKRFGVSQTVISSILLGKTYKEAT